MFTKLFHRYPFLSRYYPYILISLAVFLVYFQILNFDFSFFDDNQLIISNFSFLKNPANIIQAFKDDVFLAPVDAYYRPLLTLSFMFDSQLLNQTPSPFIFHLTNLAIHLITSLLLFRFFQKFHLSHSKSLFFSLVFAVHPALTQAVAWIPGRNDSLLTLFTIAAFSYFVDYISSLKKTNLFASLLFFAFALFTKETTLIFPLITAVYLLTCISKKIPVTRLVHYYFGILLTVIFWLVLRHFALSANPLKLDPNLLFSSFINNSPAILVYLGKAVIPANLSVLPILAGTSLLAGFLSFALLVVLVYSSFCEKTEGSQPSVYFSPRKKTSIILFGSLWFLLFLLPSLPRPTPQFAPEFLEHRLYLPIAGLFLIISEISLPLKLTKTHFVITGSAVILILATLNIFHTRSFRDPVTFWLSAVQSSYRSPLAHRNLGAMYYLSGKLEAAKSEFTIALSLNPREPMAHNNLGLIYASQDQLELAEAEYQKELEINPEYDDVHFNLGVLYFKKNQINQAIKFWERTININPYYLSAYRNLAIAYYQKGNPATATRYLQEFRQRGGIISSPFPKTPLQ